VSGDQWWQRNRIPKAILVGGLVALPFGLAEIGISWASVYGPRWLEIPGVELFFFLSILAVLLIPFFLLGTLFQRTRAACFAIACALASVVFTQTVLSSIADRVRMSGFRAIAVEARPLVAAIRAYQEAHGKPPATLADIPPALLHGLPFHYYSDAHTPTQYHGNSWVLSLDTGSGFLNWDQFLYYPQQNYPATGHGGWLRRIEEWAYVHE
jgi:hypothetical protein